MWGQPRDWKAPNQAELEAAMNRQFAQTQRGMEYGFNAAKGTLQTWPHWAAPHDHDEDEDEDDESKHHCTDFFCFVVFVLAVAGLGCLLIYSSIEGDTRRLYHGYNFTGHLCGVDAPDKPYVFWCKKSTVRLGMEEIDVRHPICVEACPTSVITNHTCFSDVQQDVTSTSLDGGVTVETEDTKYVWSQVNDYSSTVYLGRYCLPEDLELKAPLQRVLNKHSMTKIFIEVSQLSTATFPLILTVGAALALGYLYMLILDKFAWCMVYTSVALVIVSSLLVGLYLLISDFTGGIDGIQHTGDSFWNNLVGLVLLGVSALFLCLVCCLHNSIEVAIGCVQA